MRIYRVKKGESISSVAALHGLPEALLAGYNRVAAVQEGDLLALPDAAGRLYTVSPFETLESVAKKFNVTPAYILEKNNIDALYPFMEILI